VLESLYAQLEEGQADRGRRRSTAVIRMVQTEDSQLTLPTLREEGQRCAWPRSPPARPPSSPAPRRRTPTCAPWTAAELVFGVGPAGTGKTYLAVAHAASLLERGDINRIILSRPAVEAGERLGFLPGDMKDKVDPYLRPLYDALYDMMRPEAWSSAASPRASSKWRRSPSCAAVPSPMPW
jgi:phosphate starvation-inducible PhoH-like protein